MDSEIRYCPVCGNDRELVTCGFCSDCITRLDGFDYEKPLIFY